MKKKAVYIKPVVEVVDIATTQLLCGSPFETLDGETTGDGFVDPTETIPPGSAL